MGHTLAPVPSGKPKAGRRRLPSPAYVASLFDRRGMRAHGVDGRLERCASLWDVRRLAARRTPRVVFDYTDGAAMSESTLLRSRKSFGRLELVQRVLRDVSSPDLSTRVLGVPSMLPVAFAPTGFTRLMHHLGEPAVASVAANRGIPYSLSTLGTTSIEGLADAVPDGRRWFQLYVSKDRSQADELVRRAGAAGYEALIVTVDAPVGGIRGREVRNGLTVPPRLTASSALDIGRHPSWWWNALTTDPLTFASLSSTEGTVGDLLTRVFDPSLVWKDVEGLRASWGGALIVKGVMHPEDAVRAVDVGADAVVVSNHGGRQLDLGGAPLDALPGIVDAVGDRCEVLIDGGFMSGAEIVGALALGASTVLLGRAYLYGLMAGGERGVARVVSLLEKEIRTTLQLVGVSCIRELSPDAVRFTSA